MKKLLLLLALVPFMMNAQNVLFEDNFDAETPDATTYTNWVATDQDGDGQNWEVADVDAFAVQMPAFAMSGKCVDSDSWEDGLNGLNPDNYLTTTNPIDFSTAAGTVTLSFLVGTYQNNGSYIEDQYSIYLTESNVIVDIMLSTPLYNGKLSDVLTANNADGSESTFAQEIDVTSFIGGSYYLTFRHHDTFDENSVLLDDIMVQSTESTSSLADIQALGFEYFPNPVNNVLNLRANTAIESVSVLNLLGQEVMRVAPNALQTSIDTSDLNVGVYLVDVKIGDTTGTIKIVKE